MLDVWRTVEMPAQETRFFQVAGRRLWVRHEKDEWFVATDLEDAPGIETRAAVDERQEKPAALAWQRWAVSTDSNKLSLLPAMPDLPLVVRPEAPMRIQSGCEYHFYVGVSVWVRLALGLAKDHVLGEWPTQIISKTWLGDPVEGELCYAVKTLARRDPAAFAPRINRAVCPVRITNRAPGYLAFERVCVRGENLTLYAGADHLWTNDTVLAYVGELHGSHLETGSGAPPEAGRARELTPARTPLGGNVLRRSFSTIRSLAETPLWRL